MGKAGGKQNHKLATGIRVAVVQARFNQPITDALAEGCILRLAALGADPARIGRIMVPGAFELPLACQMALASGYAGVVAVGAVIRGDTPHFDYVAGGAARGCMEVMINSGKPVLFCVLTCDSEGQAWERTGGVHGHKGEEAADGLAEMLSLRFPLG